MTNPCGAGTPARELQRVRVRHRDRLVPMLKAVVSALREIFDESAYARFLDRKKLTSSVASYEAFQRELEAVHRRPKCC